jgi:hypothetical protein
MTVFAVETNQSRHFWNFYSISVQSKSAFSADLKTDLFFARASDSDGQGNGHGNGRRKRTKSTEIDL